MIETESINFDTYFLKMYLNEAISCTKFQSITINSFLDKNYFVKSKNTYIQIAGKPNKIGPCVKYFYRYIY